MVYVKTNQFNSKNFEMAGWNPDQMQGSELPNNYSNLSGTFSLIDQTYLQKINCVPQERIVDLLFSNWYNAITYANVSLQIC